MTSSPSLIVADAADVEAHRRVELERVAAGRRLGIAEHHADLHPDLVDEDDDVLVGLDGAGELAQRLAHEPRLKAAAVAHLALDLGPRHEGRDRVDDDDVDGAGATSISAISSACSPVSGWLTSRSSSFTPSFAAYDGSSACSASMNAATPPAFCAWRCVQRERGLAGGFRAEDLEDASAGKAADAERDVERERPGRDAFGPCGLRLAELMIAPLPNCFSIWASAAASALDLVLFHDVDDVRFGRHAILPYWFQHIATKERASASGDCRGGVGSLREPQFDRARLHIAWR